jgi:hypothetical protein
MVESGLLVESIGYLFRSERMRFNVLVIVSTLLCIAALHGEDLSVDQVMTRQEQESAGIDRMSPQERAAFERWLGTWTRKVIQQAPTYHPSYTISQWVQGWPGYMKTAPIAPAQAAKERQEANQTIFRNKSGAVLELNDGSVWNVCQIDQAVAQFWARKQRLLVTRNQQLDLVRPYILINEQRQEQVGAVLAKTPNPEGRRPPDNPNYFRGAVIVKSITSDGITVTLANGNTWIVAPTGQQIVQTTWGPGDRLRVERSSDAAYTYRLNNLDSGGSVLANPPNTNMNPSYYRQ